MKEVTINPTTELPELTPAWEIDSGGHRQNLVHQQKGAVTPKDTDPDLLVSVQEFPAEAWVGAGLLQGWGH